MNDISFSDNQDWICHYTNCNKFFHNPVVLPCGETICNNHVLVEQKFDIFDCKLCDKKHSVPKDGFRQNKALSKIMTINLHLNSFHKKVKKNFDELNEIFEDIENKNGMGLVNPDNYLFEFFSNIKNQLDLERESAISKINISYENAFRRIEKFENDCKLNSKKIKLTNFEILKNNLLPGWFDELRCPNLENSKLEEISNQINLNSNMIKLKINEYKSELLLNQSCYFEPSNHSNCFGNLIIQNKNDSVISSNFGKNLINFKGHYDCVSCVQVVEDRNIIISGSADNKIKVWSLRTGDCMKTFRKHSDHVSSLLVFSNQLLISASYDETIRLWTLADDQKEYLNIDTIDVPDIATTLCKLDENLVACGHVSGSVCSIDMIHFKLTDSSLLEHDHKIVCMKLIDSINLKLATGSNDTNINIINYKDGKFDLTTKLKGHENSVTCLEIHNEDKEKLFSGSRDKTIKIWNIDSGTCLQTFNFGHSVLSMKMISSFILIVGLGSDSQNIIFYDINRTKFIRSLNAHNGHVDGIELLKNDLTKFISYSSDSTIKIWTL